MTRNLGCNHAVGRSIQVTAGGRELFTYVYNADDPQYESPRPYFHPIRTLTGDLVSVYRPWDHLWHKGLAWSLPHFGRDNFWGGPTYAKEDGYQPRDNNGSQHHDRVDALDVSDDEVRFAHHLSWHTQSGKQVVDELRTIITRCTDDGWVLRYETAMTNVSGEDVPIGSPTTAGRPNAGYGGLFWRGPRCFTNGTILSPQGSGRDELMGQRAPWMGFTARQDETDTASTIIVADDTGNVRHPPRWFVRSENFAAVCPAPWFSEELPVPAGSTLNLRYAVLVADGLSDDARANALADQARKALG
ncbi:PmoA family protein [Kribbella solani]|uniref:Methane monooxygenase PmoA-like n=1 Tax=Kribbella solani TaxID=236067 RepID=A0A841DXH5_9ACTN|nr:PmoA family protein [Kribbella solani]MBB5982671.1 hypothetical protein [Kribbella solani]